MLNKNYNLSEAIKSSWYVIAGFSYLIWAMFHACFVSRLCFFVAEKFFPKKYQEMREKRDLRIAEMAYAAKAWPYRIMEERNKIKQTHS